MDIKSYLPEKFAKILHSVTFPVFRVSLPQKLNYHKNQAVAIPKVANMSDPR